MFSLSLEKCQTLRSSWTHSINVTIEPSLSISVSANTLDSMVKQLNIVKIIERINQDQYLGQHKKYFVREMRLVIYSQFLESYKTVTLENMASAFGVTSQFIDGYLKKQLIICYNVYREISEFIASRRLNCKIDKVSGLIESEKVDKRNNLYQTAVKQVENRDYM